MQNCSREGKHGSINLTCCNHLTTPLKTEKQKYRTFQTGCEFKQKKGQADHFWAEEEKYFIWLRMGCVCARHHQIRCSKSCWRLKKGDLSRKCHLSAEREQPCLQSVLHSEGWHNPNTSSCSVHSTTVTARRVDRLDGGSRTTLSSWKKNHVPSSSIQFLMDKWTMQKKDLLMLSMNKNGLTRKEMYNRIFQP